MPSIKDFISKERLNPEIMSELERSEEKKDDRSNTVYKGYDKMYDLRKFKTTCAFGDDIWANFINIYILIYTQQTMNKTTRQSVLKNLKVR